MLIDAERTEAAEQHIISKGASGEMWNGLVAEEVASQGRQAKFIAWSTSIEELEGGHEGHPKIVASVVGEITEFGEEPQSVHAVIASVDFALRGGCAGREDQVPLFDHHEEEQAIDEAEEVLVI